MVDKNLIPTRLQNFMFEMINLSVHCSWRIFNQRDQIQGLE